MANSTLHDLEQVRKKLQQGWCQEAHAKDKYGNTVPYSSLAADNFCIMGAIYSTTEANAPRKLLMNAICEALPKRLFIPMVIGICDMREMLVKFNDHKRRKQKHIVKLLDRAIKKQKRRNT